MPTSGTADVPNQRDAPGPCASIKKRMYCAPLKLKERPTLSFSQANIDSNINCPLLARLPTEIRLQIWQYAMGSGGYHYHLLHVKDRLTHQACPFRHHDSLNDLPYPCCRSEASRSCCSRREQVARADLTLLRTCRQIYLEAAELSYATNVFNVEDLHHFVTWSRTILPTQLAAVRTLMVQWKLFLPPLGTADTSDSYTAEDAKSHEALCGAHIREGGDTLYFEFWDTVAVKMVGLQDLRLKVIHEAYGDAYFWLGIKCGDDVDLLRSIYPQFKPILKIRGLKRFELKVIYKVSIMCLVKFQNGEPKDTTDRLAQEMREIVCKPSPS